MEILQRISSVLLLSLFLVSCGGGGGGDNDGDGGGVNGTDSLISMDLAAGAYIIVANSFLPETGSYTLETTF